MYSMLLYRVLQQKNLICWTLDLMMMMSSMWILSWGGGPGAGKCVSLCAIECTWCIYSMCVCPGPSERHDLASTAGLSVCLVSVTMAMALCRQDVYVGDLEVITSLLLLSFIMPRVTVTSQQTEYMNTLHGQNWILGLQYWDYYISTM